MTTLTVEIDKEKDLPVLKALLTRLNLKFHIDNDDYQLSESELEGINAGLADIEAGRTHTMEELNKRIERKIAQLKVND